jgi:hypothetical protein
MTTQNNERPMKTVKVVRTNKASDPMESKRVSGSEVKSRLIAALTNWNIVGYMMPKEEDLKVYQFIDQDGGEHMILVNTHFVTSEEKLKELYSSLHEFYNNTYNSGTECLDKTILLDKVFKIVAPDIKISSTVLFSFMLALNPFAKDIFQMNQFWYNVMKIMTPEIFIKSNQ